MALNAVGASRRKVVYFLGDSQDVLREFPEEVRREFGQAIYQYECGESHPSVKRMRGINALEIVSDYDTNTYRGVFTTQIKNCIYVLHCFQKKSTQGSKTPRQHVSLIKKRLKLAEEHFKSMEKQK